MARAFLLAALLIIIAFAGCITETDSDAAGAKNLRQPRKWAESLVGDLVAGPSLWNDPQNAPHPAYGWPTLSSPATLEGAPSWWTPVAAKPLPNPIKGIDLLAKSPEGVTSGAGMAIFGHVAIVPGYGKPTALIDISDPAKPVKLSEFNPQEGMTNHRGAATIAYPDGRLVAVISTGAGIDVWDITDPMNPEGLPPLKPEAGFRSHKVGVIPGTPIVVNAASRGGGANGGSPATATGVSEMFDLTDPMNPVRLPDFKNGYSCHHVYFWNDAANQKFRGICAGKEMAQLWDTTDPKAPKVIVNVPIPHGQSGQERPGGVPMMPWAHYAGLSQDGKILIVGDENGGGSSPPGCVAEVRTPQGSISTPIGALWFYDVSDEKDPMLLGWYSPLNDPRLKATPSTSCTAHHGRIVPVQGRDLIAMSFYGAGVVLVDFTDIDFASGKLPVVVDQYASGSDTWETWYNQGYLFTGDLVRGMDTIKFE